MQTEITVEELNSINEPLIIDIRTSDAYERGTIPEAINIPVSKEAGEDLPDVSLVLDYLRKEQHQEDQPVYLLCHTGEISLDAAELLQEAGYICMSIKGGYRTYLAARLRREAENVTNAPVSQNVQESSTPPAHQNVSESSGPLSQIPARQMQIERSLIKKFRKELWCRLTKAVREYQLISEGDKIAVCISGGKDSMLMAKLMQEIQRHGTMRFEIVFLCMNPGYNEENWELIQNNAKILGIPLTTFHTQIFDAVANVDHHPCYLCARMRRGYLYNHAKELGCNKIALGHHYDDVIETILMGILYAGKTETMMPKLHSQNFPGMELIRPLYLIREADIKAWCRYNDLHFIQCACRFTETCSIEGGNTGSKRAFVKKLIEQLSTEDAYVEQNIFNCVRDINLRTILGYHKDGTAYNFLDDYEAYRK